MITLEHIRVLFVLTVGVTIFAATYAVASAPSRVASRLGTRGLKRQRVLSRGDTWASIEPLVRWLGARVSGLLGDGLYARLDAHIALAGDYLGLTPEEYVALSILGAMGGTAFGAVAGLMLGSMGIFVVFGTLVGAFLPYLQLSGEAQRRRKEITRGLPYVIDLMALAMSAGLDFPGAVRQVIEKSSNPEDPIIEELTRVLQELNIGRTRKQALLELARRAPSPPVQEFVGALVQAEERGNPVAEVLMIQAEASRARRTVAAEEAAAKAGVRMVLPLILIFLCIMLLIMGPMVLELAANS